MSNSMTCLSPTDDFTLRSALYRTRLNRLKAQPHTLVVNELGLAHARSRVDVAVINGCIHGYEIKSARDSLRRLSKQIDIYRSALQKVTIVAASRHITGIRAVVPGWCGILEAIQGPRGGVTLETIRSGQSNPDLDTVVMAHLLWRPEVINLLLTAGYSPKDLRGPRRKLYELIPEHFTASQLTTAIREFMLQRLEWRDRTARA